MRRPPDPKRPKSLALILSEVVSILDLYDMDRDTFDQDAMQHDLTAISEYLQEHTMMDASIYGGVFE